MEPADLNSQSPDDAQLDAWLRQSSVLPPLPDNGFSAQVIAALPPRAPRRRSLSLSAGIVGAVAGIAFAIWQGAFSSGWAPAAEAGNVGLDLCRQLSDPTLLLAVFIAAASAICALNLDALRRLF